MFDLNIIPLNYLQGQEQAGYPGLFATATPRHPARGRAGDLLVTLITSPSEISPQPGAFPDQQKLTELLELLAKTYYQIPGTVTTALRSVVEVLNQNLLDYNLHQSGNGRQALALLNLAAIHSNQLYLAHCGPTHTFVLSPRSVDHFNDQQLAGRGLGLGRGVSIRYYQAAIESGSALIFCPEPPAVWSTSLLTSSTSLSGDALKRRLVGQLRTNLNAAIIQCSDGNGKITVNGKAFQSEPSALPERQSSQAAITETMQAAPSQIVVESQPDSSARTAQPAPKPTDISPQRQELTNATDPGFAPARPSSVQDKPIPAQTSQTTRRHSLSELTRRPEAQPSRPQREPAPRTVKPPKPRISAWQLIAPYWKWFRSAQQRLGQLSREAAARILPGAAGNESGPSAPVLAFIAIAVPVVIAAVGLAVYLQKGLNDQYMYYFTQAQAVAQDASLQSDTQAARNDWQSALILLNKAKNFKMTSESSTLQSTIQNALDQIDSVVRLTFQPALVNNLPKTAQIEQIVTTGNDLYLLDGSQGAVMRALLTGRGYEIDLDFKCGPGLAGNLVISPLVEIAPMPIGNPLQATIIAIDQTGNLIYCQPGSSPTANHSGLVPPGENWGKITAFAMDNNELYVLDPQVNIGMYASDQAGGFDNQPSLFFDSLPALLGDVVDMAVNAQDLYLLHKDGHITLCTFSPFGVEATRCTEPTPYSDPRPGHVSSPVTFPGTQFSHIEYTSPPDPSVFLLDPNTATIYHFSLRLNLQRLLRPQPLTGFTLPGGAATAFYISQNRMVFMAFGNQVLLSYLP